MGAALVIHIINNMTQHLLMPSGALQTAHAFDGGGS